MSSRPPTMPRRQHASRAAAILACAALVAALPLSGASGSAPDGSAAPDETTAEPAVIELASKTYSGTRPNAHSYGESLSADGRYVSFSSAATDVVPGDTNGAGDSFVRDRQAGVTERVSISSDGSEANGGSGGGALSADGRFVAFTSTASNLVPDDTNGFGDVFVRDRMTDSTERVSVDSAGNQSSQGGQRPAISADGRYVAFLSDGADLVEDDTNGSLDVFVHDRTTGETTRVSVASDGSEVTGYINDFRISADGRFVLFESEASDLVADDTNEQNDVFVHDRMTGETTRVSVGTGGTEAASGSWGSDISADGRYVTFASWASNLVPDDTNAATDIFVHDRLTSTTTRVSLGPGGVQANDYSAYPVISDDARYVAYESEADNLVASDENGWTDVFLTDRLTGVTERMSVRVSGLEIHTPSYEPEISGNGRVVTFESTANFASEPGGFSQVWLRDRGTVDEPARLRVTTTPALPALILVDGIPRDHWGLDWVELDPGAHEVCFGPFPGFTPPDCEQVVMTAGQTTTVEGQYAQRGTLRVTTSPALPSTITLDGHPANDWGVWSDLDPGTYEVCFGPAAGYDPPSCEDAVITAGTTTTITGTFTANGAAPGPAPGHGYLRVVTSPAVASRITIDGHPADTWGLTWLKLDPGTYQVCFEEVPYTTAPACQNASVSPFTTTVATGTFTVHGFLKVDTSPALPATITVDGHPTDAWGVWTSRTPGTYEICFDTILGYLAPLCQDAVVAAGDTTTITGTYTPL